MDEHVEWVVLGRVVGTASGWDQADTFVMQLYDFKPSVGVNLPASDCITFDFDNGLAQTYDDNGNVTHSSDIIESLFSAIRRVPSE